jgi:hypothetical protein
MADEEMQWSIDQILLRTSAMYGITPLESEMLVQFLSEEIKSIILEFGYGELTLQEVILAMKLNFINSRWPSGLEVQSIAFFGDFVSAKFISNVLDVYLNLRHICTRTIENHLDGY